jgi:ubiquinone/menaquinone biosynthesis C-methylase UbiE
MSRIRKLFLMGEHTCPWWVVHTFDNPFRRLFQNPASILRGLVKEGQTVLDVGCGAGYFSLGLAKLVGPKGRVHALDVQPQMLDMARRRAARRALDSRIEFRRCESESLGLDQQFDLVLAFWMVHEVPNQEGILREIKSGLKADARCLLVEPKVHVPRARFEATVDLAKDMGFEVLPGPRVWFSRSILLKA